MKSGKLICNDLSLAPLVLFNYNGLDHWVKLVCCFLNLLKKGESFDSTGKL